LDELLFDELEIFFIPSFNVLIPAIKSLPRGHARFDLGTAKIKTKDVKMKK
jgi:hypothetical protein